MEKLTQTPAKPVPLLWRMEKLTRTRQIPGGTWKLVGCSSSRSGMNIQQPWPKDGMSHVTRGMSAPDLLLIWTRKTNFSVSFCRKRIMSYLSWWDHRGLQLLSTLNERQKHSNVRPRFSAVMNNHYIPYSLKREAFLLPSFHSWQLHGITQGKTGAYSKWFLTVSKRVVSSS